MTEPDHSVLIAQFCDLTGVVPSDAEPYLVSNEWNVAAAASEYYEEMNAESESTPEPASAPPPQPIIPPGGGRTLGGDSVPSRSVPSSSISSSQVPKAHQPKKKFASLRDFEESSGSHGRGNDDGDSDKEQEYFAGGDKSALAVQNPNESGKNTRDRMVQRLLDTARRGSPHAPQPDASSSSRFTGAGVTLGGDDIPSQRISDSSAETAMRPAPPMVERILHLWADGFSVDDGPLYRYDDPANEATLDMINRGAAPLELMNVQQGQEVDVKLLQHRGENYVKTKAKYKPFSSGGHRLGSPTPGVSTSSARAAPSASSTAAPAAIQVNDNASVVTLQIRLGDGTRLQSRFNTTHTIGDVYAFVNGSSAESSQRAYTLMTTFPSMELSDKDQALGDVAEFKRGGVVVQKWT